MSPLPGQGKGDISDTREHYVYLRGATSEK
ncbi:hypothetical protein M2418_001409 [Rhizobium sp. BIGb0125]|nr:hypothetical protein [Rhizobium sp. BIGb0125]